VCYVAPNDLVIGNGETGELLKETVSSAFKAAFCHLAGGTTKGLCYDIPSIWLDSNPRCPEKKKHMCQLLIEFGLIFCHEFHLVSSEIITYYYILEIQNSQSQWPRGPRNKLSSLVRTRGSWVRIPLEAWMSVCVYWMFCVVLCVGSGLVTGCTLF
jgi:hypothetical protein